MKPDQLNLKEDKVGNNLELKGPGKYILNRTHLAQTLRSKISKWILIKLKSFCITKDIIIQTKKKPIEWEKILINYTFNRGWIYINDISYQENQ